MCLFYFLFAFISMTFAQTQFNCAKEFWPSVTPGDSGTIDDQCTLYPSYPIIINNINVTVVYTQEWAAAWESDINVIAPTLFESLRDSIDFYDTFAVLPSKVVVILTAEDNYPYTAGTAFPIDKTPPCQIETWKRWTDNSATDVPRALQVLAHELYHCVQQLSIGRAADGYTGPVWIMEGSAAYFSNLVFPTSNVEWPGPEYTYNPALPIYGQVGRDVYETELFFQALEQSKGYVNIHNWVMANGLTTRLTDDEERTRLSQLPGFTDNFFEFAKQFSLKLILDTSGVYIPGLPDIPPVPTPLSLNADGSIGTATLKGNPFTIMVYEIDVSQILRVLFPLFECLMSWCTFGFRHKVMSREFLNIQISLHLRALFPLYL